jgi:predicted metal-dependent hydrolase
LRHQDIRKIVDVFTQQLEISKYARMVPLAKIEANDYNLNIPRYIDNSEEEYRAYLKETIPDLIAKWESDLGVPVQEWGVQQMKTKWGTCNIEAGRIWVNLELAKKSPRCLEYIIVYEMVHLQERLHNDHFRALMNQALPQWQSIRDDLNREPLAHEDWEY